MHDKMLFRTDRLVVGWDRRPVLPPLSFEVQRGQLWGLVGRNGSGKSTLLKTILGMIPAVSGRIELAPRASLGFVPQRSEWELAVPARVKDLAMGGLDTGWRCLLPWPRKGAAALVARALKIAQAEHLAHERFATLSGGQMQRVWLARALVLEPNLLALDEPTSALDPRGRRAFRDLLRSLPVAQLVASHDLEFVVEVCPRVVVLDGGRVVAVGPTATVLRDEALMEAHGLEVPHILRHLHPH